MGGGVKNVADLVRRFGGEPPRTFRLRGRTYERLPLHLTGGLDGAFRCKGRAAGWPGFVLWTCDDAAPSVRYVTILYDWQPDRGVFAMAAGYGRPRVVARRVLAKEGADNSAFGS